MSEARERRREEMCAQGEEGGTMEREEEVAI